MKGCLPDLTLSLHATRKRESKGDGVIHSPEKRQREQYREVPFIRRKTRDAMGDFRYDQLPLPYLLVANNNTFDPIEDVP